MKKQHFDRLVTSIRQAGAIRRGELEPSQITEFAPLHVRAIREGLGKSQSEFARDGPGPDLRTAVQQRG